jgi:hypothetical protein
MKRMKPENEIAELLDGALDGLTGEGETDGAPVAFHPLPVPARCCGTILQASYAEAYDFCCPTCGDPACYVCGCTEQAACSRVLVSADGLLRTVHACGWAGPGMCSFCYSRAAYELYQKATGRPADDPYYMTVGRGAREFKGLGYGV